ncbi:MAG: 50S ribosomal protein L23 [Bacteroidia bacterium]|nr:MAG: 50S ribosomal protein L23 [Bacteroidia bacterium]
MSILIEPIITEKMTAQTEKLGQYGFIVEKKANKIEIAKAVESFYNVTVESVNTMIYGGIRRRRFTKSGMIDGKTKSYKKAIVTLAEGDSIDFYSNI